jgi:acyl-CoA thioester hydrolase
VRYVETDAQTIVYHANYLVYCDAARVEWFRALAGGGTPWPRNSDERDYDVVLAHASLDWKSPAKFDDPLTVWMRLDNIGTSSFTFVYRIERQGTLLCEAKTVHVAIDRAARTKRALPDSFKERLRCFAEALG